MAGDPSPEEFGLGAEFDQSLSEAQGKTEATEDGDKKSGGGGGSFSGTSRTDRKSVV